MAHWEGDKFKMTKAEKLVMLMTLQLPDDFPEVVSFNDAFAEAFAHRENQIKEELDRHEQSNRKIEDEFESIQVRLRRVFLEQSKELIMPKLESNPEVKDYIDMIDEALKEL